MEKLQRILYVEDDLDIQQVADIALQTVGGFAVKICSSGEQAITEAEEFSPQLILLDVMMPSMDGPSTLQKLRELPSLTDIPVVFMTAKVQPDEIAHFRSLGAIDVIAKPFDPMALAEQINNLWKIRCERQSKI